MKIFNRLFLGFADRAAKAEIVRLRELVKDLTVKVQGLTVALAQMRAGAEALEQDLAKANAAMTIHGPEAQPGSMANPFGKLL